MLLGYLLAPAGIVAGFWLSEYMSPSYVTIRIYDSQKCLGATYRVHLKEKIVSITGEQIIRKSTGVYEADTRLTISVNDNSDGYVYYAIEASYKDCKSILSSERKVKPGWHLYEGIRDGAITHKVRSR